MKTIYPIRRYPIFIYCKMRENGGKGKTSDNRVHTAVVVFGSCKEASSNETRKESRAQS